MVWFLSSDKTLLKAAFAVLDQEDKDIKQEENFQCGREMRLRTAIQKVANGVWFFSGYLKRRLKSLAGRAYYGHEITKNLNSLKINNFNPVVKIIKADAEILRGEDPMHKIVKKGTRVLKVKKTQDDRPVSEYGKFINHCRRSIYNLDEKGLLDLLEELNKRINNEENKKSSAAVWTHLANVLPGFFDADEDRNVVQDFEYPFPY